jgi:hypothetical protein
MGDQTNTGCEQRSYFKALLFAGLLLSETQLLVNLKSYTSVSTLPAATLTYFVISNQSNIQPPSIWASRSQGIVLENGAKTE